jgi:7-keto-8-aminopelargonate synthetase-like enzyme
LAVKYFELSLNDYLGLANHPEVRQADTDAAVNTEQLTQWELE